MNLVLMLALAQALPDGAGKAVTERMCKGCHGLDNVVRARFTEDKWAEVVDDMVSRGAKGTDDEVDQVIKYLSAHFGPRVNVNKAGASDLKESLGISTSDADAIVQYRTEKGTFKTIQDLMKVPGIDAKKVEGFKDRVEF